MTTERPSTNEVNLTSFPTESGLNATLNSPMTFIESTRQNNALLNATMTANVIFTKISSSKFSSSMGKENQNITDISHTRLHPIRSLFNTTRKNHSVKRI